MSIPGGPGLPPNTVPVIDAVSPLARSVPANRGATRVLCPPKDCALGPITPVVDLRSYNGCTVGEVIGVGLGIKAQFPRCSPEVEDEEDDAHPLEDRFVHVDVRAIITWGIGGSAAYCAELDWLSGTQLSILADNIKVAARYRQLTLPWEGDELDAPPSFEVAAGFALGNVGRNSNPARLTELAMIEESGGIQRFRIPNFAISYTVLPFADSQLTAYTVGFGGKVRVPISVGFPISNAGQYNVENAFPIPNGARYVEIRNEGPFPGIGYVIFGLAL